MTLTLVILTTALTAVGLFFTSRRPLSMRDSQREARELIDLYDAHPLSDSTQQSERDYRLYHELKRLLQRRPTQHRGNMALWMILLIITALTSAAYTWYVLGGNHAVQWKRLDSTLDAALIRSQYLNELPPALPAEDLNTYCQLLQMRIDRTDPDQLNGLAQCYVQYNNYPYAAGVYHALYRIEPDNDETALNYAQSTLFSNRGRPMSDEIEAILHRLIHNAPDNIMPKILLAAGYRQSERDAEALPLWESLADTTPTDHPLYPMIEQTLAETRQILGKSGAVNKTDTETTTTSAPDQPNVANPPAHSSSSTQADTDDDYAINADITIAPDLLAQLPPEAKLYLIASPVDNRMPLAVSRHDPQARQTITLSDSDTMNGQTLSGQQRITLRVKLSADGTAMGTPLAEHQQILELPAVDLLHIAL